LSRDGPELEAGVLDREPHTIGAMLAHLLVGDARPMKHPAESLYYEFRIRGLLGGTLLGAFPELAAQVQEGVTVLAGWLPDQSALYGVLSQIEQLGLELLGVSSMAGPQASSEGS
jgi:hypothetical protein